MSNTKPFQCKYLDFQTRDKLIDTAVEYEWNGPADKNCWVHCCWFVINDYDTDNKFNGCPFDPHYEECSVDEMITILKSKGIDDMKNEENQNVADFQFYVPDVNERYNILDIATDCGWKGDMHRESKYWEGLVYVVVYPQSNEIGGNMCPRDDLPILTIEQALDIIQRKNCAVSSEPGVVVIGGHIESDNCFVEETEKKVKTELIEFVRDKHGRRVGCVAAVKDVESGEVTIGWSKCMTKPSTYDKKELGVVPDIFDKQWSIDKAVGRARSNTVFSLTLEDGLTINQSNANRGRLSSEVPSMVRPVIRKMAQRAQRYFKPTN